MRRGFKMRLGERIDVRMFGDGLQFVDRRSASEDERQARISSPGVFDSAAILARLDQPLPIDDIEEPSGLNSPDVIATLFSLGMKGVVRRMPGKQ
ncbi:MAG TPA: hypothetical protein VK525_05705 [Candidatus Saccharimonadales bacterium]|nr:hypothetical protein [Candidatus Saccharimonadales bacterium]